MDSKNFDQAVRLLAPEVEIEVPINDHPTKESFAEALVGLGGLVAAVELLCELAGGNQAILLYDMPSRRAAKLDVLRAIVTE